MLFVLNKKLKTKLSQIRSSSGYHKRLPVQAWKSIVKHELQSIPRSVPVNYGVSKFLKGILWAVKKLKTKLSNTWLRSVRNAGLTQASVQFRNARLIQVGVQSRNARLIQASVKFKRRGLLKPAFNSETRGSVQASVQFKHEAQSNPAPTI